MTFYINYVKRFASRQSLSTERATIQNTRNILWSTNISEMPTKIIIGECFDDWRRSSLFLKLASIQYYELFSKEQFEELSKTTQDKLNFL